MSDIESYRKQAERDAQRLPTQTWDDLGLGREFEHAEGNSIIGQMLTELTVAEVLAEQAAESFQQDHPDAFSPFECAWDMSVDCHSVGYNMYHNIRMILEQHEDGELELPHPETTFVERKDEEVEGSFFVTPSFFEVIVDEAHKKVMANLAERWSGRTPAHLTRLADSFSLFFRLESGVHFTDYLPTEDVPGIWNSDDAD